MRWSSTFGFKIGGVLAVLVMCLCGMAQTGGKQNVDFGTVTAKEIRIVDSNGRAVIILRSGPAGGVVATYGTGGTLSAMLPLPAQPAARGVGPATTGRLYSGVGGGHWVNKTSNSGGVVVLEDRSLWEISTIDRIDTMLWLITEEITVLEGDNPVYPYKLINTDTGDKVDAKYLGKP